MIVWALYEARRQPAVWQRLQEEADATLDQGRCGTEARARPREGYDSALTAVGRAADRGGFRDRSRIAGFDSLAKLVYHRMVLKEALRLYPSAPLRGRSIVADTKLERQALA